jgi:lauroyl/myristoyl acyltransferase
VSRTPGPSATLGAQPAWPARVGGYRDTLRRRHRLVAHHLRRIYGAALTDVELERRVSASFASYGRYWAESLRLPSLSLERVEAGLASDGFEHLFGALSRGQGVIVALPHLGGWEWAGTWMARRGYPVSVVVEGLDPPEVFDWFVEFRRSLGLEVIRVGPGAGAASLRALRANRVLCLLCDRVVGQTPGVKVELFGAPTSLPAGPVTLAYRIGAPLVAGAVYYAPGRPDHLAVIRPPLLLDRRGSLRDDVRRGTQALAVELEALIRRAPTQWHMMQPNWPGDPE